MESHAFHVDYYVFLGFRLFLRCFISCAANWCNKNTNDKLAVTLLIIN